MIEELVHRAKSIIFTLNENLYYELEEDNSWEDDIRYKEVLSELRAAWEDGSNQ